MLLAVPLVSADASLKASLLRYDPLPAAPGQFVTAYIKLENVEKLIGVAKNFLDTILY
mgnify:CR=1 FL=1